jgi:uracil-DNA glycosylase family 4
MEDAAEKLDQLARTTEECTRCPDIVACRLRALSGAGHPHARVMFVSLAPSPEDEEGALAAGTTIQRELTELIPSLGNGARESVYFTTLLKCVPRSTAGKRPRRPKSVEKENCYNYLSTEISITTPHYIVPIGDETASFVLGKLFGDAEAGKHDPCELRAYESPSFKVVPIAAPGELAKREAKDREVYLKQMRALTSLMGL